MSFPFFAGYPSEADVNTKDKHGLTELHYVAMACNPKDLYSLLLRGADVNAKDSVGRTALHLAVLSTACPHIVAILIDEGADTSLKDDVFKETAFSFISYLYDDSHHKKILEDAFHNYKKHVPKKLKAKVLRELQKQDDGFFSFFSFDSLFW
ncbi:MAG: ankyrin repeat domain-containing protein [Bdellovibrionales bacterium]|nr:ankyrin repeat domain-containing protein [Bdellovibrionales bacterium]